MKKDQQIQEAIKQVGLYLKKEKPYLFSIDKLIGQIENGIIEIRIYHGKVTDIAATKRYKFPKA